MTKAPADWSSDPIDILLAHDTWATGRMLEICAALGNEELDRVFALEGMPIGPGSIRATLVHVITRYWYWADNLTGRGNDEKPPRPSLAGTPNVARMREGLESGMRELRQAADAARRRGLEHTITTSWRNAPILTAGAAIVHVTTHSMHHRAQCLIMLRRLGRADIAAASDNLSVADWQSEVETGRRQPPPCPTPRS